VTVTFSPAGDTGILGDSVTAIRHAIAHRQNVPTMPLALYAAGIYL